MHIKLNNFIAVVFFLGLILTTTMLSVSAESEPTGQTESTESVVTSESETVEQIQEERQQRIQETQQQAAERQEQRAENLEARCEITTGRINNVTARYSENRLRYTNRYERLITRLENLNNYLNEQGIDSGELTSQIERLKELQVEFDSEIGAAIAHLEDSKQFACGQSEGAFRNELQNARQDLLQGRSSAVEINQYFQNTVVPQLQLIRDSIN
ncbi:MAG: hypothetical protein ACOCXP_00260 [Candidatus Dojkabacteria bacterium]